MPSSNAPSLGAVFTRVFWMLLGPLLLLTFAVMNLYTGNGWFTAGDIAYLVVLGAMILARWWEFRTGRAETSMGEPATPGHLRQYVVKTLYIGLAIWAVTNLIGNHFLSP